jgi:hypothetical protein
MNKLLRQLASLAENEPHSTLGLAAALRDPSPLKVKVVTVGPRDRSACILVRDAPGYWSGYPVLADPTDAPELARAIDRSCAVRLHGWSEMVQPVGRLLERGGSPPLLLDMVAFPFQEVEDFGEPDETTRMATPFDVDRLVELFDGYEISLGRTTAALRRILDDAVRRMWVVTSLDGDDIVGAMLINGFTPKYVVWGHMSVAPHARGQGRSWSMILRVGQLQRGYGLGFVGVTADTNPMKTPPTYPDVVDEGTFMGLDLSLPDRVPGERAARKVVWRVDRKVRRSRPQRDGTFSRREAGLERVGRQLL